MCLVIGCRGPEGRVLGKTPVGNPRPVNLVQGGESPAQVVLEGAMVEKCPVAGCWFRLEDGTGTIKVDTKAAGFVVSAIPVGAKLTVGGKVAWEGSEPVIQASGLRY